MKSPWRTAEFWLALALGAALPAAVLLVYPGIGPGIHLWNHDLFHTLTWVAAGYLALVTPIYFFARRRFPKQREPIMKIHVFGNLLALSLISFHFAFQVRTPSMMGDYPRLGVALFVVLAVTATAGFLMRYRLSGGLRPVNYLLHIGLVAAFYTLGIIHVIQLFNAP